MRNGRIPALAAALLFLAALCAGARVSRAQPWLATAGAGSLVRIEARFADPATGIEAGWGATGQILIAPRPADPVLQRWQQVRSLATSLTRQSVSLAPGERGLIRVGRGIPFAGWFLRYGTACGVLERGTEWREVESALEVQAGPPGADGSVRLTLTPEFSYLSGRSRGAVALSGEQVELVLAPGAETRFVPAAERAAFYGRLLAGYDPLRRVWPVELILRVDLVESPEP